LNIAVLCEGKTELAFRPTLLSFLESRLSGRMPRLKFVVYDGAIPTDGKLKKTVSELLSNQSLAVAAVIALTDVYPKFVDANDAKAKMRFWVGDEQRFYPHVALHDFEAWLLPYWSKISELAKRQSKPFSSNPETVNHGNPPAHRLKQLFEEGKCRDSYNKPRDAGRILREVDLSIAIEACAELKALVNTILTLCDPLARIP
jgi:Domain of unknown function (DUF4276)